MNTSEMHEKHMLEALVLARKALKRGEVPIGAVVVDGAGIVIGRGYNLVEGRGCQLDHAEARAIRAACRRVGGWRLENCTLYVTLEPCLMCFGLIGLSRIKNVYFGAPSPLFGISRATGLANKKIGSSSLGTVESGAGPVYHKGLSMRGGLKAQDCVDILKLFFKSARVKKGVGRETEASVSRSGQEKAARKKE